MKKIICYSTALTIICFIVSYGLADNASLETNAEHRDWETYIGEGETNIDSKSRAGEARQALSSRLDEIIEQKKSELDEQRASLLDVNQKDWINYAKSRAQLSADLYRGGTHAGLAYSYKMIDLYKARIADIKDYDTP